jgi:hypothetical protein
MPAEPTAINDSYSARRSFDRRILILFAVMLGISIGIPTSLELFAEEGTVDNLVSSILGLLILSFTAVGVPVFVRYRRSSLTPRKRILRWIVILSIVMTAVSMVATALGTVYAPDVVEFEILSAGELLLMGAFMAATLFITFVITCYVALMAIFGTIGILSALERLMTPWVLTQVVLLSGVKKPSLQNRTIRWLFDIPDVLDTKTLSLNPTEPRTRVLMSDLRAPVLWQLIFGFVLGIYISFNPFISDRSPEALLGIFSLLASASTLFPFLILPWFLFRRIGVGIEGQTKQFTLYNGVRSRVFRSYFAVGTIIILIRLSIQEIAVAFETYVIAFSAFMAAVLASALLSTFVYLNYFENCLADDVIEGLRGTEIQVVPREGLAQTEG